MTGFLGGIRIGFMVLFLTASTGLFFNASAQAQDERSESHSKNTAITATTEFDELIVALADEDFQIRQDAERRLIALGAVALSSLEKHRSASDHELRQRVVRTIGLISRDTIEQTIQGFLAHKNTLPGWETFSSAIGSDDRAREMFLAIFRKRHSFLARHALDSDKQDLLEEIFAEFRSVPLVQQTDKELAACLSMQIITSLPNLAIESDSSRLRSSLWQHFNQTATGEMVTSETNPYSPLHRAAAVAWLKMDDKTSIALIHRLNLANKHQLPEGLAVAVKCLESKKIHPSTLRGAISLVAAFGDESHVPLLMNYLEHAYVASQFQKNIPAQAGQKRRMITYRAEAGDLALAAMIHLSGLKYKEFGINVDGLPHGETIMPVRFLGFADDNSRQAARKKWKTYHDSKTTENKPRVAAETNDSDNH